MKNTTQKNTIQKSSPNPNPNPNPNHCSSSFLSPLIKLFFSFEKYNMHKTHLYKTIIQHANVRKMLTSSETHLLLFLKKWKRKGFKKIVSYKT